LLNVVEDTVFDIYVFRSYADYAWEFLLTTARESSRVKLFGNQSA
jgi:sarcosine oxidase gamma subunit